MITLPFQRKRKEKLRPPHAAKEKSQEARQRIPKEDFERRTRKEKTKKELGKSEIAFFALEKPIISEKGTQLEKKGKYLFKVFPRANKNIIKRAVEELYKVKVEKVNIIQVPAKKVRLGKTTGEQSGYKKAIVTLQKGKKIETVSR